MGAKGLIEVRIMLLADTADKALWDYLDRRLLEGIDLILSCGDLPGEYLSFLTCFTQAPILYVCGNHDDYVNRPPEGCICVEDDIYEFQGLRVLGLGGSMKYRPAPNMYTEWQMARRARKLWWKLRRHGGFDILLTHAPARGVGDHEDLPHRGFQTFNRLMDRWKPRYMAHGHVHPEYAAASFKRERQYGETLVVNGYKRYVIDYPNYLIESRVHRRLWRGLLKSGEKDSL